ncbi:metallophosphoesterase [Pseudomonas sp.]|uniref:metallophosphoesterase n=1 Tax=Pseudomonas sp. TaxID=306 RepID=UPI00272EF0EB|nr:metallophosphoesterase [Pseudomonas sp.]MDP2243507.1 metallophosphoesterase [Pseudomonas sp.]
MYDLIGDIHGHAAPLKALLKAMDYFEQDGVWQHLERTVIFLGDFVDRGPEQLEVIRIARSMVEHGHAQAVMGNHEFNAVAWATPNAEIEGEYLRIHSDKNHNQHVEFLTQVNADSELHEEIIAWFKTLPLYLDLEGLRVVHACWQPASLQELKHHTDDKNCILPEAWAELTRKGSAGFEALEIVLKGLEIPLPEGVDFADKDGHRRQHIRTKWWDSKAVTYRDIAMVPLEIIELIPHEPISDGLLSSYANDKPVFLGHYWLNTDPAPLNEYIACLDYSIAAKPPKNGIDNRKLCAYRWSGEQLLCTENFISVNHQGDIVNAR